jgi:Domain of unknown function (DUF1772)
LDTAAEITLYIALTTGALVAGGQLFCLLAVIPAFNDWPDEQGVFVHQAALSERPHRYLRVLSPIAVVAAAATVAIEHSTDTAVILSAVGFVFSVFNGIYSQREWPINHEIDSYGAAPTAEQVEKYRGLRQTWDSQHVVRTVATCAALLCFAAAAVVA